MVDLLIEHDTGGGDVSPAEARDRAKLIVDGYGGREGAFWTRYSTLVMKDAGTYGSGRMDVSDLFPFLGALGARGGGGGGGDERSDPVVVKMVDDHGYDWDPTNRVFVKQLGGGKRRRVSYDKAAERLR